MNMVRCPACSTIFRASPEQLVARAGLVRCGRCLTVFNARDQFVEEPAAADSELAAERRVVPGTTTGDTESSTALPELVAEAGTVPVKREAFRPQADIRDPGTTKAAKTREPFIPLPGNLLAKESVDSIQSWQGQGSPAPVLTQEVAEKTTARWRQPALGWSAVAVVGAVCALLQMVYLYRSEIAQGNPSLRPILERWCARLDCRIELPRQADLINIDTSDLQPDPNRKEHLILTATVKNRAAFDQAFPHLELTLTNARNQALARRVIVPEAYLPAEVKLAEGFPAHAEVGLRLVVNASGVGATGYQLYLFYP